VATFSSPSVARFTADMIRGWPDAEKAGVAARLELA
jgi:hypothetical protein